MYYFNFESKYITHLLMAKFVWIILCTHDKILVLFPQKKKKILVLLDCYCYTVTILRLSYDDTFICIKQ